MSSNEVSGETAVATTKARKLDVKREVMAFRGPQFAWYAEYTAAEAADKPLPS